MKDIVLFKKPSTPEPHVLYLDDVLVLTGNSKKDLLTKARKSKKVVVYKASTEELLRFVLEKVPVDVIVGVEKIHPKDSVHYLRGGLDQVLCTLAAKKGKTIGFSLSDVMNSNTKAKLLARMNFNMKLCKKYGVKTFVGNFSTQPSEVRSAKDLAAFSRMLQKQRKF